MYTPSRSLALLCLAAGGLVEGIDVDFTSASSIKSATSTIAYDMLSSWYFGNQTGNNPGNLPPPYYWWEAGAMFMHLVDYWYYTGDASNNPATIQAISWQAGTNGEFQPSNQTSDEGNDDQAFWAFSALAAAECNFPDPPAGYPSYIAMGQAVFNVQTPRWDPSTCGGGLRWQFNPLNPGYTYKNIAANGGYFQVAARLARYTGNETYVQYADKMWDWIAASPLYDASNPDLIQINDGAEDTVNCTNPNPAQYSYNYGILIAGLAYLYNHTQNDKYMAPMQGIVNGLLHTFSEHNILVEAGCEPYNNCNTNGLTFKSFTVRWLVVAAQLVPSLHSQIWPYITASAAGAAGQCDGWNGGQYCGYHWTTSVWDGTEGVGQQMSAMAVINAALLNVESLAAPLTLSSGGKSKSDPSAGGTSSTTHTLAPITTADRAGAGIVTFLALAFTLAGTYWLIAVATP